MYEDISDEEPMAVAKGNYRTEVEVYSRTGYRYTKYNGDIPVGRKVFYEDSYYKYDQWLIKKKVNIIVVCYLCHIFLYF